MSAQVGLDRAQLREEAAPGSAFAMRGPVLRRLAAEQLWDSLLVLLVEDVDERKSLLSHEHSDLNPVRLEKLTHMSADEIIERAKIEKDYRIRYRAHTQRLAEQSKERNAAKAKGDAAEAKRLQATHAAENARFDAERNAIQMGGGFFAKETDPRWRDLPNDLVRASEVRTPIRVVPTHGKTDAPCLACALDDFHAGHP